MYIYVSTKSDWMLDVNTVSIMNVFMKILLWCLLLVVVLFLLLSILLHSHFSCWIVLYFSFPVLTSCSYALVCGRDDDHEASWDRYYLIKRKEEGLRRTCHLPLLSSNHRLLLLPLFVFLCLLLVSSLCWQFQLKGMHAFTQILSC